MIRIFRWLTGLLSLAYLVTAPPAFAEIIDVPAEAPTIRAAIAIASAGDQVVVSPGVYFEHDITVKNGVSIVGVGNEGAGVIIDASGQGRIFWCENVGDTTTIENLTLTGGRATGDNSYDSSGGAILCSHSQPQIRDCTFLDNAAEGHGGAVRVTYASPRFSNCLFIGNRADLGGGAIDLCYGAEPIVENCLFKDNVAEWGGSVSARADSHPLLKSNIVLNNVANGTYGYGGGLYCDYDSTPVVQWTTFRGNAARYGGAVAAFAESAPWFGNCSFVENRADLDGGGLYCQQSSPHISQSIIAFQSGTAIACNLDVEVLLECCDIFGNSGGDWVGDIASQLELRNNLCVDPLFCGDASPYGDSLTLQEDSPCTEQNNDCGLIGAWQSGCLYADISLLDFQLTTENGIVRAEWQLDEPQLGIEFRLEAKREGSDAATWIVRYNQVNESTYLAMDYSQQIRYGGTINYALFYRMDNEPWQWVQTESITLPQYLANFQIERAYPNPFNPTTSIKFTVSNSGPVRISVYDLNGRLVTILADRNFAPGRHSVDWNATDRSGKMVSSGPYFAVMETEEGTDTQKLTLLK